MPWMFCHRCLHLLAQFYLLSLTLLKGYLLQDFPCPTFPNSCLFPLCILEDFKTTFIIFFLVENECIYTVFSLFIKLTTIKKSDTVVPSYPWFHFPYYQLPVGNHSLKTLMEKSRQKQLISFKLCILLNSVMKSCTTHSIPLGKWIIPLSSMSPQMLILRVYFKKIKYLEQFWVYLEMQGKLNTRK